MAPRKVFERELENLRQEVIQMGSATEELVKQTIEAIIHNDKHLAKSVILKDDEIDAIEIEIEKKCVSLIAHQQPIASDLRLIMSILKMVTDLERIADHCEDICNYSLKIEDKVWDHENAYQRHIEKMGLNVQKMLKQTLDSFVQKDVAKIKLICEYDDKIDSEFARIWNEIISEMVERKEFISDGADYIMIIKYFERIADHTTNIAEWLIYNITGEYAKEALE